MEAPQCNCYKGFSSQRWGHVSYAQHADDFMILNLAEQLGIKLITYLDLGAHHPTEISNTQLLYEKGMCGVNIEANPHLFSQFEIHRRRDKNVNIGVGLEEGLATFYMYDDYSGLNTFSFKETARYSNATPGGVCGGFGIQKRMELQVKTLNQIVNDYCGGKFPVLLNCDIEGLDEDVMRTTDFSQTHPDIICIEVRENNSFEMTEILTDKGFRVVARMGENILYVHESNYWKIERGMGLRK